VSTFPGIGGKMQIVTQKVDGRISVDTTGNELKVSAFGATSEVSG